VRPHRGNLLIALAATLAAAGLALVVAAELRGVGLSGVEEYLPVALLAAAAALALLAWRNDVSCARAAQASAEAEAEEARAVRRHLEQELEQRQARLDETERARAAEEERAADAERRAADAEEELGRERAAAGDARAERDRLAERLRLERELTENLRRRLAELHERQGALGDTSDVRELVLTVAVRLLDAEKGLLLSRVDADADGDLDLAAAVGFEHDPEASAVTQHFAREVLERDQTVRANDPEELELQGRTPADEEVRCLVAIPIYIRDRFDGVVVVANKPGGFDEYDDEVLLAIGDHAGATLQSARLRGEVRTAYLSTVRILADAIEAKDRRLRGHSEDVARYVTAVATSLGLEPRRREELLFASLLHDIGKIGISERILLKPGPLTAEERGVVELHPRIGYRLVQQIPMLDGTSLAVLHHHERWDGDGYPDRLTAEQIPLEARIVAVADAFSAMTADRPYRGGMTVGDACAELERCAGTQFDPEVVRLFVQEIRRNPPREDAADPIAVLDEPELAARRRDGERILGFGAFSAVDNLTLLHSHRYLHEVARAEASRAEVQGRPFAVVGVRLTRLDAVNREDGYAAGDEELRTVADAVQRVAGRCGGTAARESGSVVCLVVPGADDGIAEQLRDELTAELEGHDVAVRCSVWRSGDSGDDVVARARGRLARTTTPA